MGGKQALLAKLRRDAGGLKAKSIKTTEAHWARQKEAWLADLGALFQTLTDWLHQAAQEKLLEIEHEAIELREEDLGPYSAPALAIRTLTAHPRTVRVQPRGLRVVGVIAAGNQRIVGAQGRVDLTCGASRTTLLRWKKKEETSWQIVGSDGSTAPLTEDAFSEVLGELIG